MKDKELREFDRIFKGTVLWKEHRTFLDEALKAKEKEVIEREKLKKGLKIRWNTSTNGQEGWDL